MAGVWEGDWFASLPWCWQSQPKKLLRQLFSQALWNIEKGMLPKHGSAGPDHGRGDLDLGRASLSRLGGRGPACMPGRIMGCQVHNSPHKGGGRRLRLALAFPRKWGERSQL